MATQQSVIKSFMKYLDTTNLSGNDAVDAAVKYCSNSKFSSASDLINKMVAHCRNANSATDFLKKYCGIDLSNKDTGAITGKDAGGSKVKTAESIVPESGSWKTFTGNSFTKNGVTFNLVGYNSDYSYYSRSYSSLSNVQKIMWRGLYSWWGKESMSLISSSYGSNFGFGSSSSATVKEIQFGFVENDPGTLAWTATYYNDGYKTASDLGFAINMDYYSNLSSTDKNGYDESSGQGYLDRTLAHEFTHAVMSANINYFSYLPTIIKEGMAELTHGIDDERESGILTLAGDSSLLSQALVLSPYYNDSHPVWSADYCAGYMLLRYLAKQVVNPDPDGGGGDDDGEGLYIDSSKNNTVITGSAYNDTIYTSGRYVKVNSKGGRDYILIWPNSKNNVTVNAGTGADSIMSAGNTVKLYGESGNDYFYMYAETANATVNCGGGDDEVHAGGTNVKYYGGDGADYILSYGNNIKSTIKAGAGKDSIVGQGSNVKMYGESGDDYFDLNSYAENITINGGAGNDIIYSGGTKMKLYGGDGADEVYLYTNATKTTVSGGAGNDSIYNGGTKTSINGGSGSDYIHLYYEASNTTVKGGTGNDTVTSYSENKVTYLYKSGDGKDVINGFNFGTDKIKITSGKISKTSYDGDDVIFKIGSGSIRVVDGKGRKITITNASGKTTTKTYGKISSLSTSSNYYSDDELALVHAKQSNVSNVATASYSDGVQLNSVWSEEGVADTWFTDGSDPAYDGGDIGTIRRLASDDPATDVSFSDSDPSKLVSNGPVLTYVKASA